LACFADETPEGLPLFIFENNPTPGPGFSLSCADSPLFFSGLATPAVFGRLFWGKTVQHRKVWQNQREEDQ
jgi:hypothetical protein